MDRRQADLKPPGPAWKQAPPIAAGEPSQPPHADGYLFAGNRHDSVPRALLRDRRLTPLERNAWQVLRLLLNDDGITTFPTYDQLAPWLTTTPYAARASHETVARALTLLRLTRWISLVRRRRNAKNGRMQGNLYVLHDEPLTPYETLQLDPEYLVLVSRALEHASKSVRHVGVQALKDMAEDPQLQGKLLPTRLQVLTRRLAAQGWAEDSYPQAADDHESEEGAKSLLRNRESLSSDAEAGEKARESGVLRQPKSYVRTVRIDKNIKDVRTVPRARDEPKLPDRFQDLKPEQRHAALAALQLAPAGTHQAILDEWDARCRNSAVRHPAGYLFGIIQAALRGEFHATVGGTPPPAPNIPPPEPAPGPPAAAEVARAHIAQLRALLGMSGNEPQSSDA